MQTFVYKGYDKVSVHANWRGNVRNKNLLCVTVSFDRLHNSRTEQTHSQDRHTTHLLLLHFVPSSTSTSSPPPLSLCTDEHLKHNNGNGQEENWARPSRFETPCLSQQRMYFTLIPIPGPSHCPVYHLQCAKLNCRYRIAENFQGRKLSGFVAIRESFLREIWGVVSFSAAKASNSRKFSPQKSYFHQIAKVFSLESFPLYGTGQFFV